MNNLIIFMSESLIADKLQMLVEWAKGRMVRADCLHVGEAAESESGIEGY